MIVVGWAATVVGLVTGGALVVTPVSETSAWLALVFLVAFLVAAWAFGAFDSVGGRGAPTRDPNRGLPPTVHRPVSGWFDREDAR